MVLKSTHENNLKLLPHPRTRGKGQFTRANTFWATPGFWPIPKSLWMGSALEMPACSTSISKAQSLSSVSQPGYLPDKRAEVTLTKAKTLGHSKLSAPGPKAICPGSAPVNTPSFQRRGKVASSKTGCQASWLCLGLESTRP